MPDRCPDRATLEALLAGSLADADAAEVDAAALEAHLDLCAHCQNQLQEIADVGAIVPNTSVPLALYGAVDSDRLQEVMRAMQASSPAPQTRVGTPATHIGPVGGDARAAFPRRPQRIGDYDVQAVLGRGGIGVVYRATDRVLGRDVAIKVLRANLADSESMRERFLREARAAASLRHENVVAIYGVGQHDEQPYLVMEYVPGGSLADRLLRKGKLACADVVRLGSEVVAGLAAAHAKGIIHRDIKPGNVLWDAEATRYKLTDFGLAKALDDVSLTRAGMILGTPEYLSPEQAQGVPVDARSDLFSLGAVLYAALTGTSPFRADSTIATVERVRTHSQPDVRDVRPDCTAELARVIERLLAKDPERRYPSAADVVGDLRRIEERLFQIPLPPRERVGRGSDSSQLSPAQRVERPAVVPHSRTWQKPWTLWAAAATFLLAAAAGIAWYANRDPQTVPQSGDDVVSADTATSADIIATADQGFVVAGGTKVHDSLVVAVDAASAGGIIEVHGNGRLQIDPVYIRSKPLTIRAARGNRPVLVANTARPSSGPALSTDSDLTVEGLEIQWTSADSQPEEFGPAMLARSAISTSGGTLRVRHCEITVGDGTICLAVSRAACEVHNCRLSAPRGACILWRPGDGRKVSAENNVLSGQTGVTIALSDPATQGLTSVLELTANTWRGRKAVELLLGAGPKHRVEVRAKRNRFGVDHLLASRWMLRGPKANWSPTIEEMKRFLAGRLVWQEEKNLYGASLVFLAHQSIRQDLSPIESAPSDLAAWEAFWNTPGSGSQQGAPTDELRSKVGADETLIGPRAAP
jgi:hypothetical protein